MAKQSNQIKDFIVKKVSAIVLSPCDSKSIIPVIQEANAAGIPVFTVDIPCNEPGVKIATQVATDTYSGGKEAAEAMIEDLGEAGGKIALLHFKQAESCLLRVKGFREHSLSRFLSDHGMIFVLRLLCAFFSVVTYSEQAPTGETAAAQVGAAIEKQFGKTARVLIAARYQPDAAAFATKLEREIPGSIVVKGEPKDISAPRLKRAPRAGHRLRRGCDAEPGIFRASLQPAARALLFLEDHAAELVGAELAHDAPVRRIDERDEPLGIGREDGDPVIVSDGNGGAQEAFPADSAEEKKGIAGRARCPETGEGRRRSESARLRKFGTPHGEVDSVGPARWIV